MARGAELQELYLHHFSSASAPEDHKKCIFLCFNFTESFWRLDVEQLGRTDENPDLLLWRLETTCRSLKAPGKQKSLMLFKKFHNIYWKSCQTHTQTKRERWYSRRFVEFLRRHIISAGIVAFRSTYFNFSRTGHVTDRIKTLMFSLHDTIPPQMQEHLRPQLGFWVKIKLESGVVI